MNRGFCVPRGFHFPPLSPPAHTRLFYQFVIWVFPSTKGKKGEGESLEASGRPPARDDDAVKEKTSQGSISNYFSQDANTCGVFVRNACGVVSLANAFRLLVPSSQKPPSPLDIITPMDIITKCNSDRLFDADGLTPVRLHALCEYYAQDISGLTAKYLEAPTAQATDLAPGTLMYVRTKELMNAQCGKEQYPPGEYDHQVVLVEKILQDGTIVVIHPDRARNESGSGFLESQWGRMNIPFDSLEKVWQSKRFDQTTTTRCAISLVI